MAPPGPGDDAAAVRGRHQDERDRTADAREAQLDEREAQVAERLRGRLLDAGARLAFPRRVLPQDVTRDLWKLLEV